MTHDLLTGRTIIVTGAATGIGRAFALDCAAQGANVVVADMNPADETLALIENAGRKAVSVRVDVADEASVKAMADAAVGHFGRIDGLINNAAYFREVKLTEYENIDAAVWDRTCLIEHWALLDNLGMMKQTPSLLGKDASVIAGVLSRTGIALGVIDAAVHTIITRKVTAPTLFDETPVGLRRRRSMVEGMQRIEAAAAAGDFARRGTPQLDTIATVVAWDYLQFRFDDAAWPQATPATAELCKALRARASVMQTMPK